MVLDTIAIELTGASGAGCVIFTQWERPNNAIENYNNIIRYYIIHADENGMSNTSYIASERSKVIYLSRCGVQFIFIRAFDKCNREGVPTMVPVQLVPVSNKKPSTTTDVTDATSVNPTSRNDQSSKSIP